MVEIYMKECRYCYDVQALVKIFYPYEFIIPKNPDASMKETKGDKIKIILEEDFVGISLFNNEIPILEKKVIVSKDQSYKNQLKIALYQILKERTGRSLDWGTLTGVRPTKVILKLIEEGISEDKIYELMRKEYLTADKKIKFGYDIAKKELELLNFINYKNGYSVYIGIPFCPTTCLYCSFTSFPVKQYEGYVEAYLEALFKEIDFVKDCIRDKRLATIYVGGGTPTALNEYQLKRVLNKIRLSFDFSYVKEFTVEAGRPDSITYEKLRLLKEYGVSRISINPQTMKEETLKRIGRNHTVFQVEEAFWLARKAGHDNINMDLIAGLPGEGPDDVKNTLAKIKKMDPDSITIHSLVTKRAARLNMETEGKVVKDIDCMTEMLEEYGKENGYIPYYMYRQKNAQGSEKGANQENIGYARPGKEGIYNILIMEEKQTILALGAGASSKFIFHGEDRLERIENVKNLKDYIERIDEMIERKAALCNSSAMQNN